MLCHVAVVRTSVSEVLHSSKTSVLTQATWHNIPEGGILYILRFHKVQMAKEGSLNPSESNIPAFSWWLPYSWI
jgi:hypothetical protein